MDKWVGCNPKNQLEVDMWHEKTILLTQLDPTGWDGGKEREKGKRRRKGEILEREGPSSL